MRYLILLMLISASASAGTLTLNGQNCGEWSSVTWTQDGVLSLVTDGTCGTAAPVPPPVSTCPAGVDCSRKLPWPVSPQQELAQSGSSVSAYRVEMTGVSGLIGKLQSAYTSGNSANREIALSASPGSFEVPSACRTSGTSSTSLYWSQGPSTQTYRCALPVTGTAWINIRHTTCPAGVSCGFYLKNY